MMLSDPTEKMDSLSLLLYMAPVATLALVPMTLWWESEAAMAAVQLGRTAPGACRSSAGAVSRDEVAGSGNG